MGKVYLGDTAASFAITERTEEPLVKFAVDTSGKATKEASSAFVLPSKFKDVGNYAFYYLFYRVNNIVSADLSSLTTISGGSGASNMFSSCTSLTSVDLSSLTTISGSSGCEYMFSSCTSLTSVDLSSLTTISGYSGAYYMFSGCTSLTSIDLSSLTTISGYGARYMFNGCTKLTSVDLSSLTTISGELVTYYMFRGCTSLKELRFPALTTSGFGSSTNQFSSMLSGVTGCTVHFPASTQAKIETMSGYPNFGGTNTTVLFDL